MTVSLSRGGRSLQETMKAGRRKAGAMGVKSAGSRGAMLLLILALLAGCTTPAPSMDAGVHAASLPGHDIVLTPIHYDGRGQLYACASVTAFGGQCTIPVPIAGDAKNEVYLLPKTGPLLRIQGNVSWTKTTNSPDKIEFALTGMKSDGHWARADPGGKGPYTKTAETGPIPFDFDISNLNFTKYALQVVDYYDARNAQVDTQLNYDQGFVVDALLTSKPLPPPPPPRKMYVELEANDT